MGQKNPHTKLIVSNPFENDDDDCSQEGDSYIHERLVPREREKKSP